MAITAAVIGATGYAGAELVRLLWGHPQVRISSLVSRQYSQRPFSNVYPAAAGIVDLPCDSPSRAMSEKIADVVFTALPHKASMALVPRLLEHEQKVIDLSADFRFKDAGTYEKWYDTHEAKFLLEQSVYGLSEIYRGEIETATLIGNPGCYPTSVLLPLLPLVGQDFVDEDQIIADAKSGTSGAGRSPSLTTHYCEVNVGFMAYKVDEHRHNPEMDEVLSLFRGRHIHITFTPHLVPMTRGMLTTLYVGLKRSVTTEEVIAQLNSFYSGKPFVRILPPGKTPNTMHVRGTNYCNIGVKTARGGGRLILVSAIDNLVKGAAGQAVQNMNIMFGFPETEGLDQVPFPL
jgi:N-acetyl-gamma-glutamyl-phosphate reductase